MMDTVAAVIGVLLCAAMLCTVLRTQRPEIATCLALAAGAAVLFLILKQILPLIGAVRRMLTAGNLSEQYVAVVLKAAAVCLLTQLTADTCRDAGETALAGKAELTGRILMLVLAVPLFEEILSLVTALVSGQAVSG